MDKKAVMFQNDSQSHSVGNTEPIALNPPNTFVCTSFRVQYILN